MAEAARLLKAAFRNDCKELRVYLKKGYDGTARSGEAPRLTLLHLVAMLECTDCDKGSMVRALLKQGVQVDVRDDLGFSPLMRCKTKAVAEALLDHGADLQARNEVNDGITSLMYAVQANNLPLVQLLASRGAALDAQCLGHKSALYFSCTLGYGAVLSALLTAGAHADGGVPKDAIAFNGTPLHAAIELNALYLPTSTKLPMVEQLLKHGATVDARNFCGQTPLMLAVKRGYVHIAEVLLAAGASVSAVRSESGSTALHYAATCNDADTLKLLLEKGADVTAEDADGDLPLHVACRHNNAEVGWHTCALNQYSCCGVLCCFHAPVHVRRLTECIQCVTVIMFAGGAIASGCRRCCYSQSTALRRRRYCTALSTW
jgi:ankyrin repeat protein